MDVRRETETVALRQNNLRVIQEELRAAQDRFDVGEVTNRCRLGRGAIGVIPCAA